LSKLGLAFAVALLVIVLTQDNILKLGIIQRLELASIDYRFESRGTDLAFKDSSDVVIVEISEESFKSLPEKWPWPRSYYARLIRNLKTAGARAVGIDLILSSSVLGPQDNDELRAAIHETGIVVLAGKVPQKEADYNIVTANENYGNMFFNVDSCLGAVNVLSDADGVLRRYQPMWANNTNLLIPAFGFGVLDKHYGLPALSIVENFADHFVFIHAEIPKYDATTFLINFYGPAGTFRRVNFVDVIDDETLTTIEEAQTEAEINLFSDPDIGYLQSGVFKDKIVIVGSMAPEEHDLFPVSFARGQQAGDNLMYGVEIHANVIENVLRNDFITKQSTTTEVLAVFFFTIVTFLVTSGLKSSKTRHAFLVELNGFLFVLAEVFVVGYAALILFNKHNYLLTAISPILAVLAGYVSSTVYHFVVERKQRMLIKSMFSTYVNPTVVEELIVNPEKLKLGGERRELTVLFSDIEGFTTLSEGMPPEQLVGLLNEYLSAMTEIIFRKDGTLDKYEGDAIMAFWGAPIPQPDHALRACLSALEMQEKLHSIRSEWRQQEKPALNVRVGINTGEMVVGNMGGMGKFDYTVIGDSVNLASRLEGANKQYKTGIMVSERTYELVQGKIRGRELDLIAVKGRSAPLKIFELLRLNDGGVDATLEAFLTIYEEGLKLYRERRWDEARKKFERALHLRRDDHPSKMYIERASLYAVNPPPTEWDGVFVMQTK
ncbi:MAG: adenylate/guanylate cyclase domain-containing protein, partial [Bacteroidota bacterium]